MSAHRSPRAGATEPLSAEPGREALGGRWRHLPPSNSRSPRGARYGESAHSCANCAQSAVACSPGVVPPRCAPRSALSTVEHGSPPSARYGVPREFHAHCATVPRELPQTPAHLAPRSAEPQSRTSTATRTALVAHAMGTARQEGAESAENRGVASNSKVSVCRLSLSPSLAVSSRDEGVPSHERSPMPLITTRPLRSERRRLRTLGPARAVTLGRWRGRAPPRCALAVVAEAKLC